ncbi:MAG: hypothetical protein ABW110_06960 [Steroidobacteraceae bacterium]
MSSFNNSADQPFVAEGGLQRPAASAATDPYRVLDELMSVVEELCPEWPIREPFVTSGKMLL